MQVLLSDTDLQYLARLAPRFFVTPASPYLPAVAHALDDARIRRPPDTEVQQLIGGDGSLTDLARPALAPISAPTGSVKLRFVPEQGWPARRFYEREGVFSEHQRPNGRHQAIGPYKWNDLARAIVQFLGPPPQPNPGRPPFQYSFPYTELPILWALAALHGMEQEADKGAFSLDQVKALVSTPDNLISTYFKFMTHRYPNLSGFYQNDQYLKDTLKQLLEKGAVQFKAGVFRLEPFLLHCFRQQVQIEKGLQVERWDYHLESWTTRSLTLLRIKSGPILRTSVVEKAVPEVVVEELTAEAIQAVLPYVLKPMRSLALTPDGLHARRLPPPDSKMLRPYQRGRYVLADYPQQDDHRVPPLERREASVEILESQITSSEKDLGIAQVELAHLEWQLGELLKKRQGQLSDMVELDDALREKLQEIKLKLAYIYLVDQEIEALHLDVTQQRDPDGLGTFLVRYFGNKFYPRNEKGLLAEFGDALGEAFASQLVGQFRARAAADEAKAQEALAKLAAKKKRPPAKKKKRARSAKKGRPPSAKRRPSKGGRPPSGKGRPPSKKGRRPSKKGRPPSKKRPSGAAPARKSKKRPPSKRGAPAAAKRPPSKKRPPSRKRPPA